MVKKTAYMEKPAFVCEECGFVYPQRKFAYACQRFCESHSSCSLDITKNAVARNG